MKRIVLAAALSTVAGSASADVVAPSVTAAPRPTVSLGSVTAHAGPGVPAADVEAVRRQTNRALSRRIGRIQRCLDRLDLRDDPLRSGDRSVTGTLVFARSGRPTLRAERSTRLPRAASSCVLMAVRSVAIRARPRGTVEVSFRFGLRARRAY